MNFTSLISVQGLYQFLGESNWVVVDCRFSLDDPGRGYLDYQTAHIPRAVYAHLDDQLSGDIIPGKTGRHPLPDIDRISNTLSSWGIEPRTQVVAYDDKGGMIASRLWWILQWLGHRNVAVLDGGFPAWVNEGYDLVDAVPDFDPKPFKSKLRGDMITTADEILDHFGDPNFLLVDSRALERYHGKLEPIDPIAGRIPGAINYFWSNNLDSKGFFVTKDVLRGRFEIMFNEIPINNITFYCGSGVTASHNVLAVAHSGLGMAKIYPGSWSHWILDPERPLTRGT